MERKTVDFGFNEKISNLLLSFYYNIQNVISVATAKSKIYYIYFYKKKSHLFYWEYTRLSLFYGLRTVIRTKQIFCRQRTSSEGLENLK